MPNSDNLETNKSLPYHKANPTGSIGYTSSSLLDIPVVKGVIRNSRFGTNGLLCGCIAIVVLILNRIIVAAISTAPKIGRPDYVEMPIHITVINILALLLGLGAIVSCVIGLCKKVRKKTHAFLGLALSFLAVFGAILLMISVHEDEQQRLERLRAAYEEYWNSFR